MDNILFNFTVSKILNIIKRKLLLMILIGLIGAAGAGAYAYKTSYTTYMARISFYVVSNPSYLSESSVNINATEFTMSKNLVPSYMLILKSDTVINKIIENLGLSYSPKQIQGMISSTNVEDTSVFYVYVICENPYEAMEIANAIADVAPEEIARIVKSGGIEVIVYASLPTAPYNSTDIIKYIIIGFVLGFGLAMVISLLIGLLDTTIRKKSDLEKTFTIPIIGEIPIIKSQSKKVKADKLLNENSPFAQREAYSTLRTNLMFMSTEEKCKTYVITSTSQGDGKSLNCINLAISFAQLDKKVLIIDADLRNPSMMKTLGLKNEKIGLSQYLAGIAKNINIQQIKQYGQLDVIDVGAIPPNPAELISSVRFADLLDELSKRYDFIFIDTSPVGVVTDALSIADNITGYVLVVRATDSKLTEEKKIVKAMEQIDAKISGFIYNAAQMKSGKYGRKKGYGYGYGYEKKE